MSPRIVPHVAEKERILQCMKDTRLIAVVRAACAEQGARIAEALAEGGIRLIEITFTVPNALAVIKELTGHAPKEVIVGAGTVLDAETARSAILAGASFVVSPSTNTDVIRLCRRYTVPVIPGALTPTEIVHTWELGADVVKIFPAGRVGGPAYVRSLKGPLPQIPLNPTGGVAEANVADYLRAGATVVSVGGALVDPSAVDRGDYARITENARRYTAAVAGA